MSAPLFWIVIPVVSSGVLILFLNRPLLLKWIGIVTCGIFTIAAWIVPIDKGFRFLFWDMRFSEELVVLGRRFILTSSDSVIIGLLYLVCIFWFLILEPQFVPIQLVPLGLLGTALILSSYAVEPIFYGALFFAFMTMVFVILLSPPGIQPTPGAYRYLIYQILGIIFILFAAWLGSWIDFDAGDQTLFFRAALMLAIGFSFLMAIFPFSSWIPMVAENNHPFLVAFVCNLYLFGVFLFGLRFLTDPGWLIGTLSFQTPMQYAGILMVGLGAMMGIFSNHLGRIIAAAVIIDIGRSLSAISLLGSGFSLYFSFFVIQVLSLGVWAFSLTLLRQVVADFSFPSITGAGRQWPVIAAGLLVGQFSLAGLPFLGGFPFYWSLSNSIGNQTLGIIFWLYVGSFGLVISGVRVFSQLAKRSGEESVFVIGNLTSRWVIIGISLILFGIGLFPGLLLGWVEQFSFALY